MEAQDHQPIGLRVFWTVGFLGLGTLSAIGAAALFPWYLAIVIAIVVVGMASACASQFRATGNYLYLISMLAMAALASFLDGVSVREILNNRQNTILAGIQAVQGTTDGQLKEAEKRVQDLRDEIANLNEQAQNMDNDGNTANDKLIPGILAKIESKKQDLPNLEARVRQMEGEAKEAASKVGVTDASRHFFLREAQKHENPDMWLISCASLVFLVPELTLALLAWSLKGSSKRGEIRPQPMMFVSHQGVEHAQAQYWQAMPALPTVSYPMPPMSVAYPPGAVREVAPPQFTAPPPIPAQALPQPQQQVRYPERTPERIAPPIEPAPASTNTPMGLGQWMMSASACESAAQQSPEASERKETQAAVQPQSQPELQQPRIEVPAPRQMEPKAATEAAVVEEEVMLSPESVPEQEYGGPGHVDRSRASEGMVQKLEQPSAHDRTGEMQRIDASPEATKTPCQPPSVLEVARSGIHAHSEKSSPTKLAKNVAAKRSKKAGMRSRGTSLAELASRLN